ncbi:MAG TPA: 2-amino-4-hydroxy-6-hydroxymethyldihydropteridine diphosphokinase [Candidatus Dormibacteraeota bacterium]|nr:2-amino-4-hydroxy-6-hydroxymethyldihydropteridine diphosphokinase [Candidatus Dormibacteraeota bacterium]
MTRVYLGLGSNLGDRGAHLDFARRRLEESGLSIVAASREENTTPLGGVAQSDFLNQVLEANTDLPPEELLRLVKAIEAEAGRRDGGPRWGPRELDIDILLYDGSVVETSDLTIPHPGLVDRHFIHRELADINPTLVADAVILVDYDQRWPEEFAAEERRLRDALGPLAERIDHVGSTSVPGLMAKAIIDVQVSVPDVTAMDSYIGPLESLGYAHVPDPRFPTYPFFRYPATGPRKFHLHVAQSGSVEETEHVVFRDRLRADPVLARSYSDLKRELARRFFADRVSYSTSKGDFVESVLALPHPAEDARE